MALNARSGTARVMGRNRAFTRAYSSASARRRRRAIARFLPPAPSDHQHRRALRLKRRAGLGAWRGVIWSVADVQPVKQRLHGLRRERRQMDDLAAVDGLAIALKRSPPIAHVLG